MVSLAQASSTTLFGVEGAVMHVSTRLSYPDMVLTRQRPQNARAWSHDAVSPVRGDERGSGYRGTLSRPPHQSVNERITGGSPDKEVFVARALTSTLAMLQMHVAPDQAGGPDVAISGDLRQIDAQTSFVDDLLSGVLGSRATQ